MGRALTRSGQDEARGITNGIMKTAVSIPDDVFEKGEKAAKRLEMSRSELYAKALEAYVDAHTPDAITESWNAMLAEWPRKRSRRI